MQTAWIEPWRGDLRAAARLLLSTFEARFGFPPDEHHVVSGPATPAELAALAALHGDALPADLPDFHLVVAEVAMPDVNNGYFLHRPSLPGVDPGYPRRLTDGQRPEREVDSVPGVPRMH